MEEYSSPKITAAMFDLAKKVLAGKEVKKVRYRATIEVPEEIAAVLEEISDHFGTSIQDLISKFASEGLDLKLRDSMNYAKQVFQGKPTKNAEDIFQQIQGYGIDLSSMMDQFKQLKTLASDLQGLQKAVENAVSPKATEAGESQGSDNSKKDNKDPT